MSICNEVIRQKCLSCTSRLFLTWRATSCAFSTSTSACKGEEKKQRSRREVDEVKFVYFALSPQ
eukprot:109008-Hanusia_phi.AAC.1